MRASLNGTRDVLHVELKGAPATSAHFRLQDATKDSRPALAEWNATVGEARLLDTDPLPRLLVIQAETTGDHAATIVSWAWLGRAHVLTAKTPEGLAAQLREASS